MGYAVDVPRNADRINKTENQHDPERDEREKVKHAEEVDAVQNACRQRDDVPACVRKEPGICLWTLYRDQITRRSWHCVQEPVLEYTLFTYKSSWKFLPSCDYSQYSNITLQKAPAERR